jgi:hypothetical protein
MKQKKIRETKRRRAPAKKPPKETPAEFLKGFFDKNRKTKAGNTLLGSTKSLHEGMAMLLKALEMMEDDDHDFVSGTADRRVDVSGTLMKNESVKWSASVVWYSDEWDCEFPVELETPLFPGAFARGCGSCRDLMCTGGTPTVAIHGLIKKCVRYIEMELKEREKEAANG